MAQMPEAVWRGEHSPRRPMARYDIVCIHTIVGYAPVDTPHFSVKADGTIYQSRDTKYQSAVNLDGNHRVIGVENEDHGMGPWPSPNNAPPLSDAQIEANAQILAWAHKVHDIPLHLCPNSRPSSKGLAYHRQGIDGNFDPFRYPGRVSGGEKWSSAFGKVCPTDNRIGQLSDILARAQAIVNGDDDMPLSKEDIDRIERRVWQGKVGEGKREATRELHLMWASKSNALVRNLTDLCRTVLKEAREDQAPPDVRQILDRLDEVEQSMGVDVGLLAQEIVDRLPEGTADVATVEQGVRNVLSEGVDE